MGKLVEIKIKPTTSSVEEFITKVRDDQKRQDSRVLLQLMEKATYEKPKCGRLNDWFWQFEVQEPKYGQRSRLD
jgi:hypothetical protein